MLQKCCFLVALVLLAGTVGCHSSVREEQIQVKESNDPLFEPRSILKRYSEGQPMGSEASSFDKMVKDVRQVDPARADILEKGLADIQKASPGARANKAKELLQKLQPSMN